MLKKLSKNLKYHQTVKICIPRLLIQRSGILKSQDLGLQTVQKLLGHGIVPIIRMAKELKNKSLDSKVLKKCILAL